MPTLENLQHAGARKQQQYRGSCWALGLYHAPIDWIASYRKMVYRRIIIFQVVDAELHKAQGFSLTLARRIWFSKPQQGRQQPADEVATTLCRF